MLDNYTLTYYITILPNIVLYSSLTKASEYVSFTKDLEIPSEFKNHPVDCFFNLYDKDGDYIISAHEQTSYLSLKAVINTVPLKMLKEVIQTLKLKS